MNDLKSVKNFVPTGKENSSLKSELESFVFLCLLLNCGWSCRKEARLSVIQKGP